MANEFVTRRGIISLGGITFPYYSTTTSYTVTVDDYFVDCLSGTFSVNLPNSNSGTAGKIFIVKNSGTGLITVDPFGGQTIDGSPTKTLVSNESICITSNGSNWTSFGGGSGNSGTGTSGTSGYSGLDGTGGLSLYGNDGSNSGRWMFNGSSNGTTIQNPGNSSFRTDFATISLVSKIHISSINIDDISYTQWFNALIDAKNAGNTVYLQLYEVGNTSILGIWIISDAIIESFPPDNTPILKIQTSNALVSNGNLTTNSTYTISWSFSGSGSNTSRGTSGTSGSISNVISKTASYTINTGDQIIIADATTAAFTLTLPTAVGSTGSTFTVKRINSGANDVTIVATSSQYIDGPPGTSAVIKVQYQSLNFLSDGSNWYIV